MHCRFPVRLPPAFKHDRAVAEPVDNLGAEYRTGVGCILCVQSHPRRTHVAVSPVDELIQPNLLVPVELTIWRIRIRQGEYIRFDQRIENILNFMALLAPARFTRFP